MRWINERDNYDLCGPFVRPTNKAGKKLVKLAWRYAERIKSGEKYDWEDPAHVWECGGMKNFFAGNFIGDSRPVWTARDTNNSWDPWYFEKWTKDGLIIENERGVKYWKWERNTRKLFCKSFQNIIPGKKNYDAEVDAMPDYVWEAHYVPCSRVNLDWRPRSDNCLVAAAEIEQERILKNIAAAKAARLAEKELRAAKRKRTIIEKERERNRLVYEAEWRGWGDRPESTRAAKNRELRAMGILA